MSFTVSDRAAEIMGACVVFGVPGDRETAYALSELSEALHAKLDEPENNDSI